MRYISGGGQVRSSSKISNNCRPKTYRQPVSTNIKEATRIHELPTIG